MKFKNIDSLSKEDIALWEKGLDSDRKGSVNRKRPKDRKLSICGDLLALEVFKERYPDRKFSIKRTEHGKPFFEDSDLFFSVSHKGEIAVCAYDNRPIGVDIEQIKPFNERLAKRICTSDELEYISNDPLRFAEIWTVKEAYSKLIGNGISMGLKSIIIDINEKTVCGSHFKSKTFDGYVCSWVELKENYGEN